MSERRGTTTTLLTMDTGTVLTVRRHVDLKMVASAVCLLR